MKNLVIVESPTKARTLSQFLGKDYSITASMGHVRDLPRGEFGVDVENNFVPKYVIPKEKIKSVNNLAREAADADKLWLATDPDREGEAIAWNLLQIINQKSKIKNQSYQRVVFHEITKDAVSEAFEHPRKIDEDLVRAQQARRVLDRLVGYKLSPLLWKKVKSGLSAGRVQSVALRIIVDREREIEAFVPQEYWEIFVEVSKVREVQKVQKVPEGNNFVAKLIQIDGQKAEVKTKDAKKYPSPPFTTSTLQQVASTKFGFSPKKTMRVAQDLYEQGLITYMRTDSVNLAPQAVEAARKYIGEVYGTKYLPAVPRKYKVKSRLAQEAHEAIRPTNIQVTSDKLQVTNSDHKKLYDLVWKRMVACQMAEAVVAETVVDVTATATGPVTTFPPPSAQSSESSKPSQPSDSFALRAVRSPTSRATRDFPTYLLRATGQRVRFDG